MYKNLEKVCFIIFALQYLYIIKQALRAFEKTQEMFSDQFLLCFITVWYMA